MGRGVLRGLLRRRKWKPEEFEGNVSYEWNGFAIRPSRQDNGCLQWVAIQKGTIIIEYTSLDSVMTYCERLAQRLV